MTEEKEISELDRKIVRLLQGDFPLVAEPYKVLAAEIGITEEQLLARIAAMREEKKIRKMGAVLRHREVGFTANCLCVWNAWMRLRGAWRSIRVFHIAMTAIARKTGSTTSTP